MFDKLSLGYAGLTRRVLRVSAIMLVLYAGLIGLTYLQFARTPSGFIPPLDRGYFITAITLPPGSSLERTDRVVRKASEILLSRPGVAHAVAFAGFDGATFTNAPNSGVVFVTLKPFEERVKAKLATDTILNDLRGQMQALREAFVLVIPPPSVPGIGTGGGFKLYVQDRAGRGPRALEQAVGGIVGPANQTPGLVQVFTLFNTSTPQIYADIDRTKAEMLGVPITRFFDTLVDLYGLDLRQRLQHPGADLPGDRAGRQPVPAVGSRCREPAHPLGHRTTWCRSARSRRFREITGPYRVPRYNLFPAAEVQGATLPGFSTGQAIAAMEKIVAAQPAVRLRLRVDRDRAAGEGRRQHRRDRVQPRRGVRVPAAGRAVRERAAAARRDPDRADVPAGGDQRRAVARHGQQHPHPDRLRGADRAGREERDPDRRVRQTGRGAGRQPLGRRRAGGAYVTGKHVYASDISASAGVSSASGENTRRQPCSTRSVERSAARPRAAACRVRRHVSVRSTRVRPDAMPGATVVRDGDFVGVVAPTEHQAAQAVAALRAEWKTTPQVSERDLFTHLNRPPTTHRPLTRRLNRDRMEMRQTYTVAYIAHAPLEPRAAVASGRTAN